MLLVVLALDMGVTAEADTLSQKSVPPTDLFSLRTDSDPSADIQFSLTRADQ